MNKLLSLLLIVIFLSACEQPKPEMQFDNDKRNNWQKTQLKQLIEQQLTAEDAPTKQVKYKNAEVVKTAVEQHYEQAGQQAIWHTWLNKDVTPPSTDAFLKHLKTAKAHGFDTQNYFVSQIDTLQQQLQQLHPLQEDYLPQIAQLDVLLTTALFAYNADLVNGKMKTSWDISPRQKKFDEIAQNALKTGDFDAAMKESTVQLPIYTALSERLAVYEQIAANGGWGKLEKTLSKGTKGNAVEKLISRLKASEDLAKDKNPTTYDADVVAAVKRFQKRHRISRSGKVDKTTLDKLNVPVENRIKQMQLNLERMRWLPEEMGERHVWVNIPEFMIRVFEEEDTTVSIVAVVGAQATKTPILVNKPMTNIIFSPTWTLPTSIAREEMQYILMNPGVLVVSDVDVWVDGKKVNPMNVDWKNMNLSRVRMRQRPRQGNSMGKAKFQFKNNHSIYLHDTPNKHDFKANVRAASHGCIRVGDPYLFAKTLMNGSGSWTPGAIKAAMNRGKEQYAKPPKPIRVHVFYLTCFVDGNGDLQFVRDVYGYDRIQMKNL